MSLYDVELRPDLHASLEKSQIDLSKLSAFQRILLTTDGTLTEILEAYVFERIQVRKLSEHIITLAEPLAAMQVPLGTETIQRKILLHGENTDRNWLFAESVIIPLRLEQAFRDDLLKSKIPIGKLWLKYKVETFKEIIATSREPAAELAEYFHIHHSDLLLCRTYLVITNRLPVMMISEKFPENHFN